jgi:protein-S-isoprenylcysteine O-methyltransferase Ste14
MKMKTTENKDNNQNGRWPLLARAVGGTAFTAVLIFLLAGRLDFWPGWAFLAVMAVLVTAQIITLGGKSDLLRERIKPGPGTKWWDMIFWALYLPAFLAVMVVGCLDSGRYYWSPRLPWWGNVLGLIAFILSVALYSWCMWVNPFFSSVVRIQTERGQVVVQEGPYRFIRHPGYLAGIIMAPSLALSFGSLWALIPAGLVVLLLVIRTRLEDNALLKELPGYLQYAGTVPYRLLPRIW